MTDLTYCYLHMTRHDIEVLDTLETPEYIDGELSDDELDIPSHMIPPNPDDSDILPSQVHPSYPYGNPTNPKHPAARPRPPYDPASRALFEDMGYAGGGVNGALRWKDLALDVLLPLDEVKDEESRAATARKMATGAATNQQPQPPQQQQAPQDQIAEEDEEEEENDENENDENEDEDDADGSYDEDEE